MKPILLIMAAGMGSRFGGMKQVAPVGPHGEIILDYACYDAVRAGFEKIVFVIKKENEALFREVAGDRISKKADVYYAYQELALPRGYSLPEGREKPLGTGHAVLSAEKYLDAPFTVTNADDYYGHEAYRVMYDYLTANPTGAAMVGYDLKNTVTENGSVSRGVCVTDEKGYLKTVTEKTKIYRTETGIVAEENGATEPLSPDTVVSMNFWGFSDRVLPSFNQSFIEYIEKKLPTNPLKAEFYLPTAAQDVINRGVAPVKMLNSHESWYGVTYKEDRDTVVKALAGLHAGGLYPEKLF